MKMKRCLCAVMALMMALAGVLALAEDDAAARDAELLRKLTEGPDQRYWPLEERAEWLHGHGLPGEDDITQEEATERALAALAEEGVDEKALEGLELFHYFIIEDVYFAEVPFWQVMYMTPEGMLRHTVYVGAASGEVMKVDGPESGNG